jgi:hypothetical protein
MIQTHDRWWQLLHDAGLLDNAEAEFQDASVGQGQLLFLTS